MSNDSDIETLYEEVYDLKERVSYLEAELDTSLEQRYFEQDMERVFSENNPEEIRENGAGGFFARASALSVEDANRAIGRLDVVGQRFEYDWALTETGDGIGLEVWTV